MQGVMIDELASTQNQQSPQAAAMGGAGVGVWDVRDDTLVARGSKVVPGAGLSVALDGDDVWIGRRDSVVSEGSPEESERKLVSPPPAATDSESRLSHMWAGNLPRAASLWSQVWAGPQSSPVHV